MQVVKDDVEKEEIPKQEIKKVAEYDPSKNYGWKPTDTFVLTGSDFGLVLNSLRALITAPLGYRTLSMAAEAAKAMEVSLKVAVELGIVKETEEINK